MWFWIDVNASNSLGVAHADLSLTTTDSPDPVVNGGNLTYSVTVINNGPAAATGVGVSDTLPVSVTLVSATPSQGTCSGTATVNCAIGNLATNAVVTVDIVVTPTTAGSLINTASVTANENDPNTVNNTALATTEAVFFICRGVYATIVGTGADDQLTGTPGPDVITGLGGHDIINGLGGSDLICGDAGNDRIKGGNGPDRLYGGKGNDRISGGKGKDVLNGGPGNDSCSGGEAVKECP